MVEIQDNLFKKALDFRNGLITEVDNFDEFKEVLNTKEDLYLHIGMALQKQKKRSKV